MINSTYCKIHSKRVGVTVKDQGVPVLYQAASWKPHGEVRVYLHLSFVYIYISGLYGVDRAASCSGRFIRRQISSAYHRTTPLVGLRACLHAVVKRNTSCTYQESNPVSLIGHTLAWSLHRMRYRGSPGQSKL